MGITNTDASTETWEYYRYSEYNIYALGIIAGARKNITVNFKILPEVGHNKFELSRTKNMENRGNA